MRHIKRFGLALGAVALLLTTLIMIPAAAQTDPTGILKAIQTAVVTTGVRVSSVTTTAGAGLYVRPGTGATWSSAQSGTWTVQPGNTANTTAWKVTGTGGTFPATQSGAWTFSGTGAAGTPATGVVTVQGIAGATAIPVSGTFWQATQPVSATDLDVRNLVNATDSVSIYGSDGTNRIIKTDSGGAVQVDVESIAAGDNNIGNVDVASIAAGDNNIGNVDIASIAAGTNYIGAVGTGTKRNSGTLHRSAITAIDKITPPNADTLTLADNGVGTGSLNASTTYYGTVIPGNRWGVTSVSGTIESIATAAYGGNTGSLRYTWAQFTGADYYDLFLSTDAAPKWVARVTEAQRAAGDYEVTAVGTVASGGGNPAGSVDVNVAGTGIQTSNTVFSTNNAYTPDAAGITEVNCAGYSVAHVHTKLALTDLRSAPTLAIVPFFQNEVSSADYHQGTVNTLSLLTALGQSLEQSFDVNVKGSAAFSVLVDTISGQGAAVSVWVTLSQ